MRDHEIEGKHCHLGYGAMLSGMDAGTGQDGELGQTRVAEQEGTGMWRVATKGIKLHVLGLLG